MSLDQTEAKLSEKEAMERIWQLKNDLGQRVVILGHHYQRDERSSSLPIIAVTLWNCLESRRNRAHAADYIIFCGVDFMAETAAMLCQPHQTVLMPARNAGCPMARMANAGDAQIAWEALSQLWRDERPDIYQNSCRC